MRPSVLPFLNVLPLLEDELPVEGLEAVEDALSAEVGQNKICIYLYPAYNTSSPDVSAPQFGGRCEKSVYSRDLALAFAFGPLEHSFRNYPVIKVVRGKKEARAQSIFVFFVF
jgi:hypothetical protein